MRSKKDCVTDAAAVGVSNQDKGTEGSTTGMKSTSLERTQENRELLVPTMRVSKGLS